ncbi:hypothetical protein E0W68_09590 [Flavobacterium salilacus subsp. salilacus]|uniref:hypothetical protein n=1 Tax=Flavobacterium TaxID=237 RepID=UPI001074FBB3|nr:MULTISPECIES: hypothetical protein [Flavobacterium]KAF2518267.1 hypothetical protein E0W68_09590 [Flavobacterium salilacus subsp. salilacus]MBE1615323.1 hypothetical protein [Flavobacterium sp. SaA2.13]
MESTTAKKQITETFQEVRNFSYEQKKEETINALLDKILELQNHINTKTVFLEDLYPRFEKITWIGFDDIDEETLKIINDIISTTRDISRSLTLQYVFLNNNYKKIVPDTIKKFKSALDDIKEITDDLEDVFFRFPKDYRFQKANDLIQSL